MNRSPLLTRPRLLLVEDDDSVRRSLHMLLQVRGYDVRSYAAAEPVIDDPLTREAPFLVADYRLPHRNALEMLQALVIDGWAGIAVMITGFPTTTLIGESRECGYRAMIEKPIRPHELLRALQPGFAI